MKTRLFLIALWLPILTMGQFEAGKLVTVSKEMQDDIYLAGEMININAIVRGDAVVAGSEIVVRDSIQQDLVVAGGEVLVTGPVKDDIRASAGTLTLDTSVGDDVIVFGGEVFITEDAVIHGNLINFSGKVDLYGEVKGRVSANGGKLNLFGKVGENVDLHGGDIRVDGEILGESTLVADEIAIGENAKFYGDVAYWSEEGTIDFKESLVNVQAFFDEDLAEDEEVFSWKTFGMATLGFWVFYVLSAFLILLLLNWAFTTVFSRAVAHWNTDLWKSFGFGLIYLVGVPLLVAATFVILVGIPVGLFLLAFYLFSILFGHLVAALLLTYYFNSRREQKLSFWGILFMALGIALALRLITLIPFIGWLISFVLLALSYGVLLVTFFSGKKSSKVIHS